MRNSEFLMKMVDLERAINSAQNFAKTAFQKATFGSEECNEWYRIMKAMDAMTCIKLTIDIHAE